MIQNRNYFGWEWGGIQKNKEQGVLFNQVTSLHYTMQRVLHSVRMVPLPTWSVTFKMKSPYVTDTTSLLKLLSEWLQCPSSTHAKAVALRLGLLKPTGAKKILQAVGELTGSPSCPRNSTKTLTNTYNHSVTLRQAEKGMHTVCKCDHVCKLQSALPEHLTMPRHFKFAAKNPESRTQLCFPPTPSYSSGLMLAQVLLGRVVKQIGKPIKLRTSLGFWHHVDVIICERTTLPM